MNIEMANLTARCVVSRQPSVRNLFSCRNPLFSRLCPSKGGPHPRVDQGKDRRSWLIFLKIGQLSWAISALELPGVLHSMLGWAGRPTSPSAQLLFFPFSPMAVDHKNSAQ